MVRTGRDLQRAAFDRDALALAPFAHGRASFAIQPMNPFVVGHEALALDQNVQSPVAEPPALAGQFDQALLQPVILPLGLVVQHAARQAQQVAGHSDCSGCGSKNYALREEPYYGNKFPNNTLSFCQGDVAFVPPVVITGVHDCIPNFLDHP